MRITSRCRRTDGTSFANLYATLTKRTGLPEARAQKSPVDIAFIIGTGRCGTTLLAKMLNANARICVPHELQILFEEQTGNGHRLCEAFDRGVQLCWTADDFIAAIRAWCPYHFHRWFDYERFFRSRTYPIVDLTALVKKLYTAIAQSAGKDVFVEQTPWYGQRLDILERLVPTARYIHVVRDGRDVAVSFARTPWWSNDIGHNLLRWHDEVRTIQEGAATLGIASRLLTVRYEDLVFEPEAELRRIVNFLGVRFEPSMLDTRGFARYELLYRDGEEELQRLSSRVFRHWFQSDKAPTFHGSVNSWRKCPDFDFMKTPPQTSQLLHELGYEYF
jgi:hypothetical protein